MSNIQVRTQVTTTVQTQVVAPQPPAQQAAPKQPEPSRLQQDIVSTSDITSGTGVIKKVAGGLLFGGAGAGMIAATSKTMAMDRLMGPGASSVGLGAALGAGIGLASVETGNAKINTAKNAVAGALIGGAATGMIRATAATMATDYLHSASGSSVGLGAALGAGIALANNDMGDKTLNNVKNVAAGALIGGSGAAIISSVVATMATDRLSKMSPIAAGLGMALGAGIAIMNLEE